MCISGGMAKLIDPGGFIAEKTLPKQAAPFAGLHGTVKAYKDLTTPIAPSPLVTPKKTSATQKLLGE